MTTETTPFWLTEYSKEDHWQSHVHDEVIADVISRTPDAEINAIYNELAVNAVGVDSTALTNLLRHWMRLSLDERRTLNDPDYAKNMRSKAKQLTKALGIIDEVLPPHHRLALSYPISHHLNAALPVHRADYLLRSLRDISHELRQATEFLAHEKLDRGPKRDEQKIGEIDALVDIYEYLSGAKASRTFDPITNSETGPFHAFVERCMRMLNAGDNVSFDWAFRQAVEHRAKLQKAISRASKA